MTGIDIENVATSEVGAGSSGWSCWPPFWMILLFHRSHISTSTEFWNAFWFWCGDLRTEFPVMNWFLDGFGLGCLNPHDRRDSFYGLLWLGDDHASSTSSMNELPRCFSASHRRILVMETLLSSAFRWIRRFKEGLQRKVILSLQISMGIWERWGGRMGIWRIFRSFRWVGSVVIMRLTNIYLW